MSEQFRVSEVSLLPELPHVAQTTLPLGAQIIRAYWDYADLVSLEDAAKYCLESATAFEILRFSQFVKSLQEQGDGVLSYDELENNTDPSYIEFTAAEVAMDATTGIITITKGTVVSIQCLAFFNEEMYMSRLFR
jgi:hypothetical protein